MELSDIFSGIGSQFIGIIISFIIGGGFVYKLIKTKIKQIQTASNNVTQIQKGASTKSSSEKINEKIIQIQKAGNNATQVQEGIIHHDER